MNDGNVVVEVGPHVEVVVKVYLVDWELLLPGVRHLHDVVPHSHVVDLQPLPGQEKEHSVICLIRKPPPKKKTFLLRQLLELHLFVFISPFCILFSFN
jgi:hypothetical protein